MCVDRHESLRTLFAAPDGIPQQVVVPVERAEFGWDVVDATGWSASRLDEAIGAAARHTFDLARHIPFHATLFRVSRHRTRTGRRGAPHRRRRLVDHPAGTRPGAGVRQPVCGPSARLGAAAGAVRRLHAVAAQRNSGISTTAAARSPSSWTTGSTPGRAARTAAAADRSALPAGRGPPRRTGDHDVADGVAATGASRGPGTQGDQLHGDPGRVCRAAVQDQREFRCGGGIPDRRTARRRVG